MGICCSKKVQDPPSPLKIQTPNAPTKNQINKVIKEVKKVEETLAEKPKRSLSEKPKKLEANANIVNVFIAPSKPEETRISTPVRTSSCTKEEVDAILIQCGRLSRSSSEKRKYSGSKRSFDFDNEKREGEEEEELVQNVSRPSPRRRRTPSRERSGSKERLGSQSQRRVSRSPNRRNETEKSKQLPAKMVSVPACEKAVATENTMKKVDISSNNLTSSNGNSTTTSKRNASPRSRSCENGIVRVSNENNNASLSRSNSRKGGEQSPFRRNPMTEIDENLMKAGGCGAARKANQIQAQQCNGKEKKNNTTNTNKAVPEQPKSCKTKEKDAVLEQCKDVKSTSKGTRSSSRRSSRDLDSNTNASNYTTSLLLEDIENYQQENTGFSLPACVSKACSIMEAVADLNSSSSDQSYGKQQESILKKYGSVSEEPQESAGSNSYVGQQQPWHARNSVDSTERNWVACSSSNLEVEEEVEESTNGRRWKRGGEGGGSTGSSRVSGTSASSSTKNRVVVGVRKDYLLPVATATAAASSS